MLRFLRNYKEYFKHWLLLNAGANMMVSQTLIRCDANGKILQKDFKVSESIVGNFMQVLYCGLSQQNATDFFRSAFNGVSDNNDVKNIAGIPSLVSTTAGYPNFGIYAPANNSNYGILFGTGTNAPTALDYKIQTLIANGNGAGQLNYLAQGAIQAPTTVGNTTSFVLQRIATNTSGNDITVSEIGIYGRTADNNYYLMYRDAASQTVLNTQTLTCQISFSITT